MLSHLVIKSGCGCFVIQVAAEAENNDNELEQRRQHGKRVRYGEVVQVYQYCLNKFDNETDKLDCHI